MLQDLYQEMFPGDADLLDQEKTASLEKLSAEVEEAMGAFAYDVFADCFAGHMQKIAAALVEAHSNGSDDAHPQRLESNEDTSEHPIDTAPQVQDFAMGVNPEGAVGHFEQKKGPMGEQIKQAALQKHLLKAQLGI